MELMSLFFCKILKKLIFEVMYKDDKKKVDEMLKCLHSSAFNMQFLLANRALEHLGFVSNLAGVIQPKTAFDFVNFLINLYCFFSGSTGAIQELRSYR